jgi:hypothetical protein
MTRDLRFLTGFGQDNGAGRGAVWPTGITNGKEFSPSLEMTNNIATRHLE